MGFALWNDDVSYIRQVVHWHTSPVHECLTKPVQLFQSHPRICQGDGHSLYDQIYKNEFTLFVSACKVCRHLYVSASCGSVVSVARRRLARCVCPTHSHSGWIRRKWWQNNGSGLRASGTVHFSPEAEGGPLVTLMDRNAAHPHTHTRPHMSHTLSLSHNNSHVIARTWTHTHRHTRSHTGCSVPPDLISDVKCLRPAHTAFLPCQ